MTANESLPKIGSRLKRIQKVSRIFRNIFLACALVFGLLGLMGMYYALCIGYAVEFLLAYRLFHYYAQGDLFTPKVVRYLRWIGITSILLGIWNVSHEVCMAVGGGFLKYPTTSHWDIMSWFQQILYLFIFNFLPGFIIIFAAWIMDEGRKIQEEQELTV